MLFEIFLIPFAVLMLVFIGFWITQEGSHWQKHRILGPFARFIQVSPARSFFTFLVITILAFPAIMLIMQGVWWDTIAEFGSPANTVSVVNSLLLMFLVLAMMIPVLWGSFRTWRHSVRQIADVRIRTTA
ncbi:MAG: hypothetical protein ACTSQZ_07505 [Candidatus Thorarchaeota archaeon]